MRNVCLCVLFLAIGAGHAAADGLRAGAAAVNINPPEGTPLAGYYAPRGASAVLDDIHSKALVLEQDGTRVALVVCDLISLPRHTVLEARALIEKQTGITAAHVMLSATHTHTGPAIARESALDDLIGANSDLGRRYTEMLPERIARSVAEANKKLMPVHVAAALGKEDSLSFNRRFIMRDQTVSWNPPKQDPKIIRPAGPIDPDVHVLTFEASPTRPLATYVNFAMHPDTTGGEAISADYPGVLARLLADCKGADMVTLFANGCCGNLNHRNIHWADPQHGPHEARRIGTVLAGAVCRTFPHLQLLEAKGLRVKSKLVQLPLAPITAADVSRAKDVVKRVKDPKTTFLDKVKAFQVLDVAARDGKPLEVEVQVMALGDRVAWVSLPGEIFVELGLAIKKASPFPYTCLVELANGSIGYIPDRPAYAQGNYEVISARCAAGSGEMLVEAAAGLLNELSAAAPGSPAEEIFSRAARLQVEVGGGAGGEGPAWHPQLGVLTSGGGHIYRFDRAGKSRVYRKDAGTNGLLFDARGRLLACEPVQRRITRTELDGTLTVLTDRFEGKRYNEPNDLTVDSQGRIYFSDPRYGPGAGKDLRDEKGQIIEGVYRIDPDGKVARVLGRELDRPNGVLVSAGDRYLYVADNNNNTMGGARKLWRFDLHKDGTVDVASRKLLYDWGTGRGPDGVKQDQKGRLYVAAGLNKPNPPFEPAEDRKGGIYVLSPEGKLLGFLPVPTDEVTNCGFGGDDLRTLYVTGGGTLYSIRVTTPGRVIYPPGE